MNTANVISVNPGRKTLGEVNAPLYFERITRTIAQSHKIKKPGIGLLNFILGVNPAVNDSISWKLIALRSVYGIALSLLAGYFMLQGTANTATIAIAATGISLIFGIFSRLCALSCTSILIVLSVMGYMLTGTINTLQISIASFSMIFAVLGPGKFSVDQLIRRSIIRMKKHHTTTKKSPTLTYNVYLKL